MPCPPPAHALPLLPHCYLLLLFLILSLSLSLSLLSISHYDACPPSYNTDCLQYWQVTVLVADHAQCTMDDTYSLSFKPTCVMSYCPPVVDQVAFSIDARSSDFCAHVVEDVLFSAVMNSYSDSGLFLSSLSLSLSLWLTLSFFMSFVVWVGYSIPATIFPAGLPVTAYFEIVGTSAHASLSYVSIQSLIAFRNGTDVIHY